MDPVVSASLLLIVEVVQCAAAKWTSAIGREDVLDGRFLSRVCWHLNPANGDVWENGETERYRVNNVK